jgi:hypothetical protein
VITHNDAADPLNEMGEPVSNVLAILANDYSPDGLVCTFKNEDGVDNASRLNGPVFNGASLEFDVYRSAKRP